MQTTGPEAARLRRIKEFAGEAGVTVRTPQFYDRLGLLKPARSHSAGRNRRSRSRALAPRVRRLEHAPHRY
jgi:DNA-binding transcriptional MerR regulator